MSSLVTSLLSTSEEIVDLAAELSRHEVIAFDTEFIRETTFYPMVEIIQVATEDRCWLVDAAAFKKGFPHGPPRNGKPGYSPAIQPLLDVFTNPKILKIIHAAQGDQECLYTAFGVTARHSLDTAVAASLCGFGEGVGLGKLLKSKLDVTIAKGHARTNWSVRPLPKQLIEYALEDVRYLVRLGKELITDLDRLGRKAWALELTSKWEQHEMYDPDPGAVAEKLAKGGRLDRDGYCALVELVRWREERVRHLNLPRRWVADDAVLLDLAQVKPKDIEHLAAFRGLNKGELKASGEVILAAVRAKAPEGQKAPARSPRAEVPSPEEAQALDLLKCYVGILADEHRIAARHLMTAGQLLPLLRNKIQAPSDLVRNGILSEAAAGLVGEELVAFLNGKRALSVHGSQIRVERIG